MPTVETCAREILDTVPLIMRTIRGEIRRHRSSDLTVPQLRSLAYLNRCPGSGLAGLAEHLGLTPPSTCTLVDGLVARSLVVRQTAPDDRRRIALTLSDQGRSLLMLAQSGAHASLSNMLARLTDEECRQVVEALNILRPIFNPETTLSGEKRSSNGAI